jgi:hypothetical protein
LLELIALVAAAPRGSRVYFTSHCRHATLRLAVLPVEFKNCHWHATTLGRHGKVEPGVGDGDYGTGTLSNGYGGAVSEPWVT